MDIQFEIDRAEAKKQRLHKYILMRLEEEDYHAVQDAASDLREITERLKVLKEFI